MASYIKFKVCPILRYYGGKSYLARRIIELLPDSRVFVEPFAGGLQVLLNKCKVEKEVAGDLSEEVIHLYKTVQADPGTFLRKIKDIPHTEESFNRARDARGVLDPVDRALNFVVRIRMSRAAMGKDYSRSEECKTLFWKTLSTDMEFAAHRIKDVEFRQTQALNLINEYDSIDTTFYLDPPYYLPTRKSLQVYEHEMTVMDHLVLLKRVCRIRGHVAISGYDSTLYNTELAGWDKYVFDIASHAGQTLGIKGRRQEIVWVKPTGF